MLDDGSDALLDVVAIIPFSYPSVPSPPQEYSLLSDLFSFPLMAPLPSPVSFHHPRYPFLLSNGRPPQRERRLQLKVFPVSASNNSGPAPRTRSSLLLACVPRLLLRDGWPGAQDVQASGQRVSDGREAPTVDTSRDSHNNQIPTTIFSHRRQYAVTLKSI